MCEQSLRRRVACEGIGYPRKRDAFHRRRILRRWQRCRRRSYRHPNVYDKQPRRNRKNDRRDALAVKPINNKATPCDKIRPYKAILLWYSVASSINWLMSTFFSKSSRVDASRIALSARSAPLKSGKLLYPYVRNLRSSSCTSFTIPLFHAGSKSSAGLRCT